MVYVENEFSYDRFHHDPENVVRIVKDFVNDDGSAIPDATTPPALARAIRDELPEADRVTRFIPGLGRRNLLDAEYLGEIITKHQTQQTIGSYGIVQSETTPTFLEYRKLRGIKDDIEISL